MGKEFTEATKIKGNVKVNSDIDTKTPKNVISDMVPKHQIKS